MPLLDENIFHFILDYLRYLCGLIVFSILGNISRAALSNYFSHLSENGEWDIYIRVNGSSVSYIPIYTDYYANLCGCFLLGIVNCQKAFLMKKIHSKSVLVTALSSWFCGSLTTFSSWISSIVLMIREGHYWLSLTTLISAIAVNYCAYLAGVHFAQGFTYLREKHENVVHNKTHQLSSEKKLNEDKEKNKIENLSTTKVLREQGNSDSLVVYPSKSVSKEEVEMINLDNSQIEGENYGSDHHNENFKNSALNETNIKEENRPILELLFLIVAAVSLTTVGTLNFLSARDSYNTIIEKGGNEGDADYEKQLLVFWSSIYFAPLGAGLRYGLSVVTRIKNIHQHIPVHTFLANMLGCVIAALGLSLKDKHLYFFAAMKIGFGGCLSTFSTFIGEIHSIDVFYSHLYGLISIVLGLGIQLFIMYIIF